MNGSVDLWLLSLFLNFVHISLSGCKDICTIKTANKYPHWLRVWQLLGKICYSKMC